jgi:hypothetical protein
LTQAQIADLFQTTPQNVTLHLKAIYAEREVDESATCKSYLQVRQEGSRKVTRRLGHCGQTSREQADQKAYDEFGSLSGVAGNGRKLRGKPS